MRRLLSFIFAILVFSNSVIFGFAMESEYVFIGIWQVDALGTQTPVYDITKHVRIKDKQEIVDWSNAAYLNDYNINSCRVVADHLNSNVYGYKWNVSKITVDSMAYLITPEKTEAYQCYQVCKAKNYGVYYKVNGVILNPEDNTEIWCSCCTPEGNSEHYVAMFKYVGSW